MSQQNYKNHVRLHPPYHYVGFTFVFITFFGSILHLISSVRNEDDIFQAFLLFTGAVSITVMFTLFRMYSMKVQDRVIRAEENFRYYRLTGQVLPLSLKIGQIVALRFASDEELVQLVQKVVDEKLSNKEIKLAIKNWREDTYRV